MSLRDSQMHGVALVSTLAVSSALTIATALAATAREPKDHEPPLRDLVTIEASLARKSAKPHQPVKEAKAPDVAKPEGVSHDETKPPPDKKPDDKKPAKKDEPPDISKFKHASDDHRIGVLGIDGRGDEPTTDIGQFDGSEKGFAPITAGNPYWQQFVADFHQVWEIPQLSQVSGAAVGCFHLEPDGKITAVKFDTPSGDDTLDDSVQRAMKATQKARNDKPQPVPTEQLRYIKRWVCFRFNPNQ